MFYRISIRYGTPKELFPAVAEVLGMDEVPTDYYHFSDVHCTQEIVDKLVKLVANHNLFEVTKVTWLEDACTNELQRLLTEGWRILAVCLSNDARRPDYILGLKESN